MNIEDKFLRGEPLQKYCTFQVGGPADYFLNAENEEDLAAAAKWAKREGARIFVFGGGSNLLFADEGFRGLVVRVAIGGVKVDGERVTAGAGLKMAELVKAAAEAGLTGLEAWHGLPGTVGGAVFGNAGCFGVEVKDVLESAHVFIPGEGVKEVNADWFDYDYRNSRLKRGEAGTVLSAVFKLQRGDAEEIKTAMMEIARKRIGKQPAGASTGSFFKNPADHAAGWLIEQCGLKGKMIGGAQISEQHGNFFLNKGTAKASDILALAEFAEQAVKEKFGIELEREVEVIPA